MAAWSEWRVGAFAKTPTEAGKVASQLKKNIKLSYGTNSGWIVETKVTKSVPGPSRAAYTILFRVKLPYANKRR